MKTLSIEETRDSAAAHTVFASRPRGIMMTAAADLTLLPPFPPAGRAGTRTRRAGTCFAAAVAGASARLRSAVMAGRCRLGSWG